MDIKSIVAKLSPKSAKVLGVRSDNFKPEMVFSILAILMVVLDLWLLQSAIMVIIRSRSSDVGARVVQQTRVDFQGYNMAVERIDGANTYAPASQLNVNPFRALKKQQQPGL